MVTFHVVRLRAGASFQSPRQGSGGRRQRTTTQFYRDALRGIMSALWIVLALLPIIGKSAYSPPPVTNSDMDVFTCYFKQRVIPVFYVISVQCTLICYNKETVVRLTRACASNSTNEDVRACEKLYKLFFIHSYILFERKIISRIKYNGYKVLI